MFVVVKTLIVFSGGLDSTTLLYHLRAEGKEVHALSVNYGQRHRIELTCAEKMCSDLGVPWDLIDLSAVAPLLGSSALTDRSVPVPEGHYAKETMKQTVVPNRNMILIALATARAIAVGAEDVAYAAHHGDHAIYPDCRTEFAEAMDRALQLADWSKLRLHRPFVKLSKSDIVRLGANLGVPFENTWSCYKGEGVHCGRCGTCIERREAFFLADVEDPTIYRPEAPSVAELLSKGWEV